MSYYTQEQYKDFVDRFAAENVNNKKILSFPFFWESDIFSLKSQELMELVIEESLKDCTQILPLLVVRKLLKDFFGWCEKNKVIENNICDKEEFSKSIWYDYAIDKIPLKIYYPEDIEKLVNIDEIEKITSTEDDDEFQAFQAEMILRMFFEGVQTKKDIASIRVPDIHLDEKYIEIRDYRVNISDKLAEAIRQYLDIKMISFSNKNRTTNTTKRVYQYKDHLIKCSAEYEDFDAYYLYVRYFIYAQLRTLAKKNKIKERINIFDVYASGFINFIYNDCIAKGKDDVYFSKILQKNANRYIQARTVEYAKAYGIRTPAPRVREIYYPYVKRRYV